jgi:hypothetical protein
MKSTGVKFGIYSSVALLILFSISFVFEDAMSYSTSEIYGYVSIVLALSFVYFGVRNYRDAVNHGFVSFSKALKIGLLITLLASVTFGLINLVYTEIINPNFTNEYYTQLIENFRGSLPDEAFQVKLKELESQKELFSNPIISLSIMALTVFIIGFIISLISGLILQRKQ